MRFSPFLSRIVFIVMNAVAIHPLDFRFSTFFRIAMETARRLGRPHMAAQAVGNAIGHNPISILIPCHRIVGSNGSLTGYAGGISRKQSLLDIEHIPYYIK